jgi:hypothetical protein
VLDAKIYPDNPNYIIKVTQYSIPKSDKNVVTYPYTSVDKNSSQEVKINTMDEIHDDDRYLDEFCSLQLQVRSKVIIKEKKKQDKYSK